jgi:phosphoribosylglycinamide formyltransferase 2
VRAVLGLPLGFTFYGEGASAAFKSETESKTPVIDVADELFDEKTYVRVFGKPEAHVGRRMAVLLVLDRADKALKKAKKLIKKIKDA